MRCFILLLIAVKAYRKSAQYSVGLQSGLAPLASPRRIHKVDFEREVTRRDDARISQKDPITERFGRSLPSVVVLLNFEKIAPEQIGEKEFFTRRCSKVKFNAVEMENLIDKESPETYTYMLLVIYDISRYREKVFFDEAITDFLASFPEYSLEEALEYYLVGRDTEFWDRVVEPTRVAINRAKTTLVKIPYKGVIYPVTNKHLKFATFTQVNLMLFRYLFVKAFPKRSVSFLIAKLASRETLGVEPLFSPMLEIQLQDLHDKIVTVFKAIQKDDLPDYLRGRESKHVENLKQGTRFFFNLLEGELIFWEYEARRYEYAESLSTSLFRSESVASREKVQKLYTLKQQEIHQVIRNNPSILYLIFEFFPTPELRGKWPRLMKDFNENIGRELAITNEPLMERLYHASSKVKMIIQPKANPPFQTGDDKVQAWFCSFLKKQVQRYKSSQCSDLFAKYKQSTNISYSPIILMKEQSSA